MSNWESASEMCAYTQQNIKARDELVNSQMPHYMDKVMNLVAENASRCEYRCYMELRPEKGEDPKMFDQIVSAVRKELKSLGYSVSNNGTRYGFRVSWNPDDELVRIIWNNRERYYGNC